MNLFARTTPVLLAMLLVLSGTVGAHGYVARSEPADGSEFLSPPEEIRIWFTEVLEARFATLTLQDAQGNPVPDTRQSVVDENALALHVPELAGGVYTLEWQILSKDTHVTSGTIQFAVGVSLSGEPPAAPTPAEATNPAPPVVPAQAPAAGEPEAAAEPPAAAGPAAPAEEPAAAQDPPAAATAGGEQAAAAPDAGATPAGSGVASADGTGILLWAGLAVVAIGGVAIWAWRRRQAAA